MNINEQSEKPLKLWDDKVVTSFSIAILFIGIGFYRIIKFPNQYEWEGNTYHITRLDVDNYFFNANFGTADFILALIFVVLGCTFLICNHLLLIYKK